MGSEWRTATVEDLIRDGVLEVPLDGNHGAIHPKASDFVPRGVPFIMASDLVGGRVDLDGCAFISEKQAGGLRKGFAKAGDVLLSHKATIGRTAILQQSEHPFVVLTPQVTYYRVRDTKRLNPRFLKYYFDSSDFQQVLGSWAGSGSTRAYLGITAQRKLPIQVPPIEIQEEIASSMGAIDDKIALLQETNATLEAIAQAIFKSWFVDFDPVRAKTEGRAPEGVPPEVADLFPSEFKESELEAIPLGWSVGTIRDIAEVIDCLHSKKPIRLDSGPTLLQLGNILDSGLMDLTERYCISDEDYSKWISRMEASPGDCVITNVGRVGAVAQMPEGEFAAMGRNMTGIRVLPHFPYPTFLIECLQSEAMRREMKRKTDMGTILDALNVRSIPHLRFCLPGNKIAEVFEQLVRPLRAKMEENSKQIKSLSDLRDTLLPRLMSGKLRIDIQNGEHYA